MISGSLTGFILRPLILYASIFQFSYNMNSFVCLICTDLANLFQSYAPHTCVKWRWNWSFVQRISCINGQGSQRGCMKETFHPTLYFVPIYKGFKEHGDVLRIVQNQKKEGKVNIKMLHQDPMPALKAFFFFCRIAEYFKYSILQSQYIKEQLLYLC